MSLFISFEGGDGSGKSTQAELLVERLGSVGVHCLQVHEPGSTPLGLHVRAWVKGGARAAGETSDLAELFLFAAARAQLVEEVIDPALAHPGSVVVADRYADSTAAYQGYGRQIPLVVVERVNALATRGVWPDITFLLDCPPEEGLTRVGAFQMKLPFWAEVERENEGVRFEAASLDFHHRVRAGYLELAAADPARWKVIEGLRPVPEIHDELWTAVSERLCLEPHVSTGGVEAREAAAAARLPEGGN